MIQHQRNLDIPMRDADTQLIHNIADISRFYYTYIELKFPLQYCDL